MFVYLTPLTIPSRFLVCGSFPPLGLLFPLHVFTHQGFIDLIGAGHCPQDEAPHLTDPIVLDFVAKHSQKSSP